MIIAVDAMGGDDAPQVVVQGALEAVKEISSDIVLVGERKTLEKHIGNPRNAPRVTIHHCDEAILMGEPPLKAVRGKKDSSIRVAFELIKNNEADAVVSAGNSGAIIAAGILTLGRIKGVDRPAFTSIFPSDKGKVIILDVGANVDCRPEQLFQFGIMAHAFASSCFDIKDPKIGLLNIGEEGSKGNEQVRQAHELFQASPLNFIGNVEGRDIFAGDVEIVVCDGFVGNVALKLSEGLAEAITRMLFNEIVKSATGKIGLFLARHGLENLREKFDYAEYGGAPVLGINGVSIVCHGGSSSKAIKNAIIMAEEHAKKDIQTLLAKEIESIKYL